MKHRNAYLMLPSIIALALLAAILISTPVFAQDEVPPEAPVPTEEVPILEENPVEETTPAEVVISEGESEVVEEIPDETPVTEEFLTEPVPEEIPTEELAPVLEAVAEAGLVLADENGEPITLATEVAIELVAGGDPYYKAGTIYIGWSAGATCPAPVLPANCHTFSANPVLDAVNHFAADGGSGAIYIEAGPYTTGLVAINAIPGLTGLVGSVDPATKAPTTLINGRFNIQGMMNGFLISGFEIDTSTNTAGIYFANNAGTIKIEDVNVTNLGSGPGISVTNHNGAVVINRAKVNGNFSGGAYIDNTAGTGGVTVTNSSFDHNFVHGSLPLVGLTIATKGALSVEGITASGNTGLQPAINIRQSGSITIKNTVVNNNDGIGISSNFIDPVTPGFVPAGNIIFQNVYITDSNDPTSALVLFTKGNITLTGVHADKNVGQGAYLDTCNYDGTACSWLGSGAVTIKDSTFESNNTNGFSLYVLARGTISLTNVSASANADPGNNPSGAYLDNGYSQLTVPISITSSSFSANDWDGVKIYSKGAVTLTKVKANDNSLGYGVFIDNCLYSVALAKCLGTGAVTITGSKASDNQFNGNNFSGLEIRSHGAITIKYADSNGNIGTGGELDNYETSATGGVTITDSNFGTIFSAMPGNSGYGLNINTNGSVALSNVFASANTGGDGARIWLHATSGTVTVTNGYFYWNDLVGLNITGKGNITLTNVVANNNWTYGAELTATTGNITIINGAFDNNGSVGTISGLDVYAAQGTISLTNVTASGNLGYGAYLRNQNASSAKAVSIIGGDFNDNTFTGLRITSKGMITLRDVDAFENNESNIDVGQPIDRVVREVIDSNETDLFTFTPTNTTLGIGVTIVDPDFVGEMWLSGCTADTTHYWDDDLNGFTYRYYSDLSGACTLRVSSYDNASGGAYEVRFYDTGGVWTDITEEIYGAELDNTAGTAGITINNNAIPASNGPLGYLRDFSLNTAGGLELRTNGAVIVTNVILDDNGGYGVHIDNDDGGTTFPTNVTLSGIYANENYFSGIDILNKGTIAFTNVASWGHMVTATGYGASLDNSAGTGGITIKNTIVMPFGFDQNHERGLNIFTNGSVTITNVQMNGNDEDGIFIWQTATGPTSVTLTNCVINDNSNGAGAILRSYGPIVLSGVSFQGNGIAAHLNNQYTPLAFPKPVTLSNVLAEDNPGGGLLIDSFGVVTLTNVTVTGSINPGVIGIEINNYQGSNGIKMTRVNANSNGNEGIYLTTNGAVSYIGGEVKYNGSDGLHIYNGPLGTAKSVTISDVYLYDNDGFGAFVQNKGSITLTNIRANSNNFGPGVYLDNSACTTTTPCPVNVLQSGTGVNEFNENLNAADGLTIFTYGSVVLNKVNANKNGQYGVSVDNDGATIAANITITGGILNTNMEGGLHVVSRGIITVSGIEASSTTTGDYGAYLDNRADITGTKGINVLKSKFNTNAVTGLGVRTYGAVILNTNEAVGNIGSRGVDVYNRYSTMKPVSILSSYGTNNFSSNQGVNLWVDSQGSVSISKVIADSSRSNYGINIFNYVGTGTVTLTDVTTRFNYAGGVYIDTQANVTITRITSLFNGTDSNYHGLYITTNEIATAKVTITTGVITSNRGSGIRLNLAPNKWFTLTGVFYFGNDTDNSGDLNLSII